MSSLLATRTRSGSALPGVVGVSLVLLGLCASCAPRTEVPAPDPSSELLLEVRVTKGWVPPNEDLLLFADGSYVFVQGEATHRGHLPTRSLDDIREAIRQFDGMEEVTGACPRVMDADLIHVTARLDGRTRAYKHNGCLQPGVGCAAHLFEYVVARRSGVSWKSSFLRPPPEICEP